MRFLVIRRAVLEAETDDQALALAEAPSGGGVTVYLSVKAYPQITAGSKPGDIFGWIIFKLTGQETVNCGPCGQRKQQMNQWGWWKCWLNRTTIATWLAEEARKRGHQVTDTIARDLIKAAFRELRHSPGS